MPVDSEKVDYWYTWPRIEYLVALDVALDDSTANAGELHIYLDNTYY